jgi:MarR family 2-MHQ and catechol resistance regulon transcriptional repressor
MTKIEQTSGRPKARSIDAAQTRRMSRDDPSVLAFVYLAYSSAMVMKLADEQLRGWNLSVARYTILRLLEDGQPRTLSYLSEKHFCVPGNITKLVTRMELDGLIEKKTDESDRRVSLVTITEKGRELCNSASIEHRRFIQEMMSDLSEAELGVLWGLLERLATKATAISGKRGD